MGKLSLISRFLVYTFDFANARNKLGYLKGSASFAGFPLWLVFHHGGVFITHAIVALFVEAQTLFHCAVMLLVLQSTHNTWTKKILVHDVLGQCPRGCSVHLRLRRFE